MDKLTNDELNNIHDLLARELYSLSSNKAKAE